MMPSLNYMDSGYNNHPMNFNNQMAPGIYNQNKNNHSYGNSYNADFHYQNNNTNNNYHQYQNANNYQHSNSNFSWQGNSYNNNNNNISYNGGGFSNFTPTRNQQRNFNRHHNNANSGQKFSGKRSYNPDQEDGEILD